MHQYRTMATDKPALTVYLDPEIKELLEKHRAENKLRSLSAAAEDIFKRFFNTEHGDYVTRSEVEPLLGKLQAWLNR